MKYIILMLFSLSVYSQDSAPENEAKLKEIEYNSKIQGYMKKRATMKAMFDKLHMINEQKQLDQEALESSND